MFNKFKNFYSNFGGWTTNRKIVVIESDDWGSIRMPSKEVYNYCIKNSYPVDKSIYTKYDSLASEEDLNLLLNLLVSKRNSYGQNPVFTINSLVANPDFGRIKQNNFQEYHYELITETFRKYPKHQRNWELWSQAASENLFYFQSHGREHLNVNRFLSDLRKGVKEAMFAFDLCMPGIFHLNNINEGNNYIVPFEFENDYDKIDKLHIVDEGLKLFEKLFGYKSVSFIAGNYVWYDEIEDALAKGGVKILQGSRFQLIPKGEYTGFVKKRNYFGKYGDQAKKVLEALLDKYAANDIMDIEDPKILELPPFNKIGTKTQIRREIFGGPDKYSKALTELEQAIYETLSA